MDKREETHASAWIEDRRRMRRFEQQFNAAADSTADDVVTLAPDIDNSEVDTLAADFEICGGRVAADVDLWVRRLRTNGAAQ